MKISSFPNPFAGNPYLSLFYSALSEHGVSYVRSGHFGQEWLRENRGKIDFLHFHWVGAFYEDASGAISFSRLAAFLLKIWFARLLGYQIVWTMHNLYPHNRKRDWKAWLCRFLFLHSINAVFVTFEKASDDLRRIFRKEKNVFLLPHGNYRPVYPSIPTRNEARDRLGLNRDDFIFFLFGGISPYKGAHAAIRAMQEPSLEGSRLVVMGQCLNGDYEQQLTSLASGCSNVDLRLGKLDVSDEDVCLWMAAIDCVVAPYSDVYTSGMLYLAATFEKPIVSPKIGVFAGLEDVEFVFLYDASATPAGLPLAMRRAQEAEQAVVSSAARCFSDRHEWSAITARAAQSLAACKA